ncbi:MAG: hypothetical protein KJ939_04395 [Nanoarchaeota archaeon]|nr:hypothetical protein [Nanoarchaeota archaeon]MCG2719630.1 hypothetical protein [Nanoarchaeota archaeon]
MVEILLYETPKEAEQELRKYDEWNIERNEEFNDECHKHDHENLSVAELKELDEIKKLRNQNWYFVAELMVYDSQYHSSATSFPFQGVNGPHGVPFCSHKSLSSLVQGIKSTIEGLSGNYPTIESIFYTFQNHNEHNQAMGEVTAEIKKIPFDDSLNLTKEEFDRMTKEYFKSLGFFEGEVRGLTEQEREEFVQLYERP